MRNTGATTIAALLGLAIPMISSAAVRKGIQGSSHDFGLALWNVARDACSPCHQAGHNTPAATVAPLWGHARTTASFTLYDSPTFKAGRHAPDGVSLACLSCHDGTVAINQLIGKLEGQGAVYINPTSRIGPDLHTTHPISFTYDASLAAADGGLEDPTAYHIGDPKSMLTANEAPVPSTWSGSSLTSQTIDRAMLFDHRVECASCHDVHKQRGSAPTSEMLLRVDGGDRAGRGDLLCRTCHIK